MNKWVRISLIGLLIAIVSIVAFVLISNYLIKEKVENFLENRLPLHISQTNKEIVLNSFEGTVTINEPIINIQNVDDERIHTNISLDKIIVEDVSYWDYFFNSEIHIEDIKLIKPKIVYFQDTYQPKKSRDTTSGIVKIYKPFIIDELSIDNSTLHIYDKSNDSLLLYVENGTIEIDDININEKTIKQRLPVVFDDYEFEADSIFLRANDFENLSTSKIKLKNNKAIVRDVKFKTKYSRKALSNFISTERDHFDLKVDSLSLSGIDFGFKKRKLFFKAHNIDVSEPTLEVFRDKLVADDLQIKKLYSESIREIPFNLTIDSVKVKDSKVTYIEKVKVENEGGKIEFQNLYASIYNVSNTYKSPTKTTIDISGKFMESTAFKANWSFDVKNKNDAFLFKMDMDALAFAKINEFTEPNLKVRLSGQTNKLYFTINGNKVNSTVDMKVNYEDLEITVLNKKGKKKNWLMSTVVNLFVSSDSKDKNNNFREAKTEVERDNTKSIFNFIWLNTSKGLLKSMTGDGEKENNKKRK